jgi:hypothetical protein
MTLLKTIFREPIFTLGIFLMVIGGASLLFKSFNAIGPRIKYGKRKQRITNGTQFKKAFVFILIAILIGLIIFIYLLSNVNIGPG